MRIADVDAGRHNNMDMIRFVAASAVIYGHAFHLQNRADPLEAVTGLATGTLAVAVFFALSGFLIARSLTTRPSLLEFGIARILRIMPALIVVNAFVALVAGSLLTTLELSAYVGDPSTWTYVLWNSSLIRCQFELPGVFGANPYGPAVNGSLWTLPVEARMYGVVFLAGVMSVCIGRMVSTRHDIRRLCVGAFGVIALALSLGGWTWLGLPLHGIGLSEAGVELMGYFGGGMLAHALRERIHLNGRVVAIGALGVILLRDSAWHAPLFVGWLVYTCLWLSYTAIINARGFGARGDFSYGIYIFAFPVQQVLYSFDLAMAPLTNAVLTLLIVLPLAAVSFWCIEKPALRLKHPLAVRIRQVLRRADTERPTHPQSRAA